MPAPAVVAALPAIQAAVKIIERPVIGVRRTTVKRRKKSEITTETSIQVNAWQLLALGALGAVVLGVVTLPGVGTTTSAVTDPIRAGLDALRDAAKKYKVPVWIP